MNSIHIKGRLTRDPETRHTDSGKSVTNFSVAVDRRFQRDKADFFNVTAWGKTGEFVNQYFLKGQEIIVEGEMQSRNYTDRDGNKRIAWEITAQNVEFCGGKSSSESNGYNPPAADNRVDVIPNAEDTQSGQNDTFQEVSDLTDEDLPF